MAKLVKLDLSGTAIGDKGVIQLKQLKELKLLNLNKTTSRGENLITEVGA